MIKFIILLQLKIIGLLFMAIGAALDNSGRRRIEREKQLEKQRREKEQDITHLTRAARQAAETPERKAGVVGSHKNRRGK